MLGAEAVVDAQDATLACFGEVSGQFAVAVWRAKAGMGGVSVTLQRSAKESLRHCECRL